MGLVQLVNRVRKFLPICAMLVGCATSKDERRKVFTSEEFIPYLEEFTELTGRGGTLIYFAKIEPPTVGLCYKTGKTMWIEIDPTYWSIAGEYQKKALILHELGHCILNLPHSEGIMDRAIPGEYYLENNWDELISDYLDDMGDY